MMVMETLPVATICHIGAKNMIWLLELGPEAIVKCATLCECRETTVLDPS